MTGFAFCWARAAVGHAAAPPISVMNSRRLMDSPRLGSPNSSTAWSLGGCIVRYSKRSAENDEMGHWRPLCATAELALFDHLVSALQEGFWHGEAKGLGCLEIDHQIVLGRRLHRQ